MDLNKRVRAWKDRKHKAKPTEIHEPQKGNKRKYSRKEIRDQDREFIEDYFNNGY